MAAERVDELVATASAWAAHDPDPATAAALDDLIAGDDRAGLVEAMAGRLEFGTAGLRGIDGPGSNRMNRAVVITTTRGLADYLTARHGERPGPVVVGFDGRLHSRVYAADTVGVLTAAGIGVRFFPEPVPTPLVAFAARSLGAIAAVMITASHNPAEYNGYKVYDANGAQIVPPVDADIAAAIASAGPADEVPRSADPLSGGSDLAHPLTSDLFDRYLGELDRVRPTGGDRADLRIVYTPLHGVGGRFVVEALHRAGYPDVHPVAAQFEPDGRFPTVRFPNPEEPGALDLAVELATGVEAGLILANDPDTDRLAVSLPRPDGTWANLTGNQIGVVLADYLLTAWDQGPLQPLVVNSIVSTPMAAAVAAAHGARHEVTLTGFKWIWNAALDIEAHEGVRFVFGFEEALGYSVGPMVRDKDGIGAAVVFADLAATLRARGLTVGEHLTDLYRRHGLWVSRQLSIVRPGTGGLEEIDRAVRSLGDDPPAELAGRAVTGFTDYRTGAAARPRWLGPTDLIALDLGSDTRVLARPSGTEPKLKIYVDLREPLGPDDDAATVAASATAAADALAADLAFRMGFAG